MPLRANPLFYWASFALLAALSLIPVWAFTFFPSQDGPAHLNTVAVQMELANSEALTTPYNSQWTFGTNQIYFLLLHSFGSFVPLLLAEKLILSLYILGLPLATLYACRLSGGSALASLLSFPLLYTLPLYMGFFNFCLSLPVFILCIGLYVAFAKKPGFMRGTILAFSLLALYFIHILPALCAVGVVLSATLVRLLRPLPETTSRVSRASALLTTVPVLAVTLSFLFSFQQYTEAVSPADLATNIKGSFIDRLLAPINEPLSPYRKAVYLLDWFSEADRLFTVPYFGLLFVLSAAALFVLLKRSLLREQLPFLTPVLLLVLLLAVAPGRYGPLGWLPGRLLPISCLLLIVWLSQTPLALAAWRLATLLTVIVTGLSIFYRLPVHQHLNAVIDEYVSVGSELEPTSTVLPLHLEERYQHEGLKPLLPKARFDALSHAAGYLALDKPLVNLRNYQPARPYFPVRYREGYDPRVYLSPDGKLSRFEYLPFHLDLSRYEQRTGLPIDYVLVWGDLEALRRGSGSADLLKQLEAEYELLDISTPKGLMHVYRQRP